MNNVGFVAICPFELGDEVKLILQNDPPIYSESSYMVDDILAVHSIKTGGVTFQYKLIDEKKRPLTVHNTNSIIRVCNILTTPKYKVGNHVTISGLNYTIRNNVTNGKGIDVILEDDKGRLCDPMKQENLLEMEDKTNG